MGLLLGERAVSGMSLGRQNSMYGSFKGYSGKQFRGFHTTAQSLFIRGLQLRTAITFMSEPRFLVFLDFMENPLSLKSIHV